MKTPNAKGKLDKCLIYCIIDFKVPLPSPYLREVWDLNNVNSSYVQSPVSNTDWDFLFRGANSNKSHGWDDLSIKMIRLCSKSIAYPLKLIFEAFLLGEEFPECWKVTKLVAVHKKRK